MEKKLVKNSFIFIIGNILSAAFPFLLIPYLTNVLETESYGMLSMYTIVFTVLNTFTGLNVNGSIIREYFELEPPEFRVFVFNCFVILFTSTLVVLLASMWIGPFIHRWTQLPEEHLPLIIITSAFQFVLFILLAILQVKEKAIIYASVQILSAVLINTMFIILIVKFGLKWEAKMYGQFFTLGAFAVITILLLVRYSQLKVRFNFDYMIKALKFGLPLIPHILGMYLIVFTDRLFVMNLLGAGANGVFTVGVQVSMLIMFLQDAFNKAWTPWFYSKLKENLESMRIKIVQLTYLYNVAIILISIAFSIIAYYLIPYILDPNYSGSRSLIIWMTLGFAFNGMYKMVTNYLFYTRNTSKLAVVTFTTALINIVLTWYLIKMNQMTGAAQATMISFLISYLVTWYLSNKIYPMPWRKGFNLNLKLS